jgi:hypothetical protein
VCASDRERSTSREAASPSRGVLERCSEREISDEEKYEDHGRANMHYNRTANANHNTLIAIVRYQNQLESYNPTRYSYWHIDSDARP